MSAEKTPKPFTGYVYFIYDGATHVKIGYSRNPQERLSALQTAQPRTLTLLGVAPGSLNTEAEFHRTFADLRVTHGNEWFDLRGRLSAYLESRGWIKYADYPRFNRAVRMGCWDMFSDGELDRLLLEESSAHEIYYATCRREFPTNQFFTA